MNSIKNYFISLIINKPDEVQYSDMLAGLFYTSLLLIFSIFDTNGFFNEEFIIYPMAMLTLEFYNLKFSVFIEQTNSFKDLFSTKFLGLWTLLLFPKVLHDQNFIEFAFIVLGSLLGLCVYFHKAGHIISSIYCISLSFTTITVLYHIDFLSYVYPICLQILLIQFIPTICSKSLMLGENILLSQIICFFMYKSLMIATFFIFYFIHFRIVPLCSPIVYICSFFSVFCVALNLLKYLKVNLVIVIYELIQTLVYDNFSLFVCWVGCTSLALSVLFLVYQINKTTTIPKLNLHCRKVFHILAVIVFITGIKYNANLLSIVSAWLIVAFLIEENCRLKIKQSDESPLISILRPLLDKRDNHQSWIISPIGLLCGLALPLWLHTIQLQQSNNNNHGSMDTDYNNVDGILQQTRELLLLSSGVITVGIGDSFAALIGRQFGRNPWLRVRSNNNVDPSNPVQPTPLHSSSRTIEGSLAGFVAMVIASFALLSRQQMIALVNNWWLLSKLFGAILATTFVEAFTEQLDNFILPIVFSSFL